LKSPIEEDGKYTGGKKNKIGVPQGGVISPLLSNIYLNLLDKAVKRISGIFNHYGIKIIRYADDFILMGKKINGEVESYLKKLLSRMGLSLNTSKTHKVNAKENSIDFLGFTIRYDRDLKGGNHKYLNIQPSRKSEQKLRECIKRYLQQHGQSNAIEVAKNLNTIIQGWLNCFIIKKVSYTAVSRRRLRRYLIDELYRYYNRKSQRRSSLHGQEAYVLLTGKYGMIDVLKYRR
jgi:hypothetical protein